MLECRSWKVQGTCRFGSNCRFLHEEIFSNLGRQNAPFVRQHTATSQFRRVPRRGNSTSRVSQHGQGRRWPPTLLRREWVSGNSEERAEDFKLICWNLLADTLVDASHYPGIPDWILNWNFRKELILAHLRDHQGQADVICLQEVDAPHYEDFLLPMLSEAGYSGDYLKRTGDKGDGCALFIRESHFQKLETVKLELKQEQHPILDRDNVALGAVLEHIETKKCFIVCTTHILFNPNRGDVKAAQVGVITHELSKLRQKYFGCPVIICGDFNSTPSSAIYELMTRGVLQNTSTLDRRHISGQSLIIRRLSRYGRNSIRYSKAGTHGPSGNFLGRFQPKITSSSSEGEENTGSAKDEDSFVTGCSDSDLKLLEIALESPKTKQDSVASRFSMPKQLRSIETGLGFLKSAYSKNPTNDFTDEPAFTTYHHNFRGTVDYIFHSEGLVVEKFLGTPVPEVYGRSVPSKSWPSDHISLVAAFSFS